MRVGLTVENGKIKSIVYCETKWGDRAPKIGEQIIGLDAEVSGEITLWLCR